jgi:hypothetical protein
MIFLEHILQALGDELVRDRCAGGSFRDILARLTSHRAPGAFGKLGGSRYVVENADGVLHIFSGKQLAGGEIAA